MTMSNGLKPLPLMLLLSSWKLSEVACRTDRWTGQCVTPANMQLHPSPAHSGAQTEERWSRKEARRDAAAVMQPQR